MTFAKHLFGSNDIRGFHDEITDELVEAVAFGLLEKTKATKMVVAKDMRESSDRLEKVVLDVCEKMNVEIIYVGLSTTSLFNFVVTQSKGNVCGMMITASHNPKEYNGIKMARGNGLPISGKDIFPFLSSPFFAKASKGKPTSPTSPTFSSFPLLSSYFDFLQEYLPNLKGKKVVVDYGNGMGSLTISPLLQKTGCELMELYKNPDANFPNHEANPAKEETLSDLKKAILQNKADVGIALDGDADRIAFLDEKAEVIFGDQLFALFIDRECKKEKFAHVVVAPNQSSIVFEMIEKHEAKAVMSKVGRTHMVSLMSEHNALLGGEVSGHYFFRETQNLESVDFAMLKVLSFWMESKMSFSEFTKSYRVFFNSREINIHVNDPEVIFKKISDQHEKSAKAWLTLDGIRAEFSDWWFSLRKSNTEPLIRLIVEADSFEKLDEKKKELMKMIEE